MAVVTWQTDAELLDEAVTQSLSAINSSCDAALAEVRAKYPESEVLSWTKQEQEARDWLADSSTETPLVDALATERGIDKDELVSRIIAKADAYTLAVGVAVGRRQRLEDQLDAILAAHQLPPNDPAHLPAEEAVAQVRAVVW